jgi:NDP-sugar pyrophosphorylase family protein
MNKNSIIVTNTKIEPSKNVQDSIIVTNKKLSFKILVPNRVLEDNMFTRFFVSMQKIE